MKDLLTSLWSGFGDFVSAWLMPSLLAVVYVFEVLVPLTDPSSSAPRIQGFEGADELLVLAFIALAVAFVLSAAASPLTRILEGYYMWPAQLKRWRITRHQQRRKALLDAIGTGVSADMMLDRERLNAYPRKPELVLPTRLGNALRAGESYGWVQYGFSVPDLWTHLNALAKDGVARQLQRARTVLELFIAATWLSAILALATLVTLLNDFSTQAMTWTIALAALVPFWYLRAVGSVAWYARAMWALADLTRTDLAESLGLQLPGHLEDERVLWKAVSEYTAWGTGWAKTPSWTDCINQALVERGAKSSRDS